MTGSAIRVFRQIGDIRTFRRDCWMKNLSVGFVPTMGYLHEGHLSLVKKSLEDNDVTLVSIFVNPAQFAPTEDLDAYPRNLGRDLQLLDSIVSDDKLRRVAGVFTPSVSEMYPSGIPLDPSKQEGAFVTVAGVSEQLEGQSRPQFFRGVATVVTKLFNIVQPTIAYFGQKDIQQSIVIRRMVSDLLVDTKIDVGATVRDQTGLALSSRNSYLSDEVRSQACVLYRSMMDARQAFLNDKSVTVASLKSQIQNQIASVNDKFTIDYVEFNYTDNLEYLVDNATIDEARECVLSLAVRVPNSNTENVGTTRLIDNILFKK
ncbi:hypothetical protein OGAPHI_003714 [Ogataea philodendri]|uniref:Pantoate--beta-alanine ligase n=1 Tax=Ogataea philodendri TaxID=1378263 RepID=A0A9P8P483_9ASCO|nr:uncharacterized protein OGAPHI_003714 [Ogataea philodendri]KAH3665528.1 hypothetical protein OGAPHI_003714 [Ogataea philodendri]